MTIDIYLQSDRLISANAVYSVYLRATLMKVRLERNVLFNQMLFFISHMTVCAEFCNQHSDVSEILSE